MSAVIPDSKIHGANMGHMWVLVALDGPHVGPMNFAIRDTIEILDDAISVISVLYGRSAKI